MPSKVEFGKRLRWVLPLRPYPFFRRLAPWPFLWLGCRTVKIAVTLDTWREYRSSNSFRMVRKYCEEIDLPRLCQILRLRCGIANVRSVARNVRGSSAFSVVFRTFS